MTSVLTILKGRAAALENLLQGLAANVVMPDEVVIVFMNESIRELPSMPFPVRCFEIYAQTHLPLSAARNLAADKATGDFLIFLDVDCIPARDLILQYQEQQQGRCLLSGQIRYLNEQATMHEKFMNHLDQLSMADQIRGDLDTIPYALFWSLNFACTKELYEDISGFDEGYEGYGAEDTDFSFSAEKKGILIQNVQSVAYHQYHDSYSPPLNHFDDIINNARRFYIKWAVWPMEGWLKAFQDRGLIEWRHDQVKVIRSPSTDEILDALKTRH